MKQETRGIPDHTRSIVVPPIFAAKYGHVNCEKMFFTDGSLINGSTGFGVFNVNHSSSHQLSAPCSIYVAELAAIHQALVIIESLSPDHYFIFTDSLSSVEALRSMKPVKHATYFLMKIRDLLCALVEKSFMITLAWVPSHCSIPGNERADSLAKEGAVEGTVYERSIFFNEFFTISRQQALTSWQTKWTEGELGRWLHSIIPKVSTRAWFKGLDVNRDFIRVMSRLMSNHYTLNAHSFRIGLAETNTCLCGEGYHDIDHVVWSCAELSASRSNLIDSLRARGRHSPVPVRDILASRDLTYLHLIYQFLQVNEIPI